MLISTRVAPFFSFESLVIFVSTLCLFRYYMNRKWQFFKINGIPHDPPSIWNAGNIRGLNREGSYSDAFAGLRKRHGPIFGMYAGLEPVITICDTDMMRQIYTKQFRNFPDRTKLFNKLNGKDMNEALLPSKGTKWKRLRSALSPAFSASRTQQTTTIAIERCLDQTMNILHNIWLENREVSVQNLFSNLSLVAIVSVALGRNVDTQTPDGVGTQLTEAVRNLFYGGFTNPVGILSIIFPPCEIVFAKLGYSLLPTKSLGYIRSFTNTIVEDRLQEGGERHVDLLQLMLDAEVPESEITEKSMKGMTRGELLGNAMLMIGGGFNNTSNVMACLSHSLAFHPDIQAKLQVEIDEAYRAKGRFDYKTVKRLKYLDMCVNETMRLYPSILINSRVCRNDTVVNGLHIPKGITVQFPVYFLAHDPDYWDDPWEFKPDRMEDMTEIDDMMFQPFGAGPRNCIGMSFAEIEIKMAMCRILHIYSFEPCEDTPKPPLNMLFKLGMVLKQEFKLKIARR